MSETPFGPNANADGEATHYSRGKPSLQQLHFRALMRVMDVAEYGEKKYGRWNWKKGMKWSELQGSALRHLFWWSMGEDSDPESGLPHLAHAAWNILTLLDYALEDLGTDDRYKSSTKP